MFSNTLSWLPGTKPKDADNKCLCYWAQVIILLQKVDPVILEELLHKSYNLNNVEFIAALDPKIAKKSLDKLIWLGYQENKQARDMAAALHNWKAYHWPKKIKKLLCYNKSECSIVDRQIYFCQCLSVPNALDLHLKVIHYFYSSSPAGYPN